MKLLSNNDSKKTFVEIVNERIERISTGFKSLDQVLDGGLSGTGQIIVIGAEPGAGKTAFCNQIAEHLASAGNPVIFFSLEMSRYELQARAVSRRSYLLNPHEAFSAGEIMGFKDVNGEFSKLEIEDYKAAFDKYFEETGENLFIVENVEGGLSAEDILKTVQENIENFEKKPILVVDYLQLLTDRQEVDRKSKVDNSLKTLKHISTKFRLPIICISSIGRPSYSSDKGISISSFKESGDIEYTATTILGMSREKDKVTIEVLKNKNGRANDKLSFRFIEKHLHFEEQETVKRKKCI